MRKVEKHSENAEGKPYCPVSRAHTWAKLKKKKPTQECDIGSNLKQILIYYFNKLKLNSNLEIKYQKISMTRLLEPYRVWNIQEGGEGR